MSFDKIKRGEICVNTLLLNMKYPDEFENTAGALFITVAEEAAKLITNVHELVQLQKVLDNSIDACPLIKDKNVAKNVIEKVLYKKED